MGDSMRMHERMGAQCHMRQTSDETSSELRCILGESEGWNVSGVEILQGPELLFIDFPP